METIKISGSQLEILAAYDSEQKIPKIKDLEPFENWQIYCDTDSGRFDSEKGAMTDFDVFLTSPGGLEYLAKCGYYTSMTGKVFNEFSITFELQVPELTDNDLFNNHLSQLTSINLSNPEFNKAEKIHDWRNYVSDMWIKHWDRLTDREKKIIFIMCNEQAQNEEWD